MDIYEFAINMELDGKRYYEELMNRSQDEGFKKIFEMLAKDEDEHHRIINGMIEAKEESIKSDTLKNANNIFAEMLSSDKKIDLTVPAIEAYRHAFNMEDKSIKLYEEHCQKTENERERIIFKRLAEEEKKHKLVMENILNFVNKLDQNKEEEFLDFVPKCKGCKCLKDRDLKDVFKL
ncbi:ferritin-like domain-containing protein [Wukongibacter sp. M2B1]|uniref:ferritin-like domain-containing protein n=1 Tax=Wukongibacter sp. M2B1 TaxID=3088895 RepID=UPI003D797EAA